MEDDRITKIVDALASAHRGRPEIDAGPGWSARVMNHIYRLEPAERRNEYLFTQRFVLRFAGVVCGLALVFLIYAFSAGVRTEQLAMKLLMSDPSDVLASQFIALK